MRLSKAIAIAAAVLIPVLFVIAIVVALSGVRDGGILAPAGSIANQERNLLGIATLLSFVVLIPVFVASVVIPLRYRAGSRRKRRYTPSVARQPLLEVVWWAVPALLIAALSVITWVSSHSLDPYAPVSGSRPAVEVDVVALQWKWLFLYPQSGIATVNQLELPSGTPVHFTITSDAPMNSFWIPQLSGQIYAMPGMTTQLNINATEGVYEGTSANLSGRGFSSMRFTTTVVSPAAFARWQQQVVSEGSPLTAARYEALRQPSTPNQPEYFTCSATMLFDSILARYSGTPMPMPSAAP